MVENIAKEVSRVLGNRIGAILGVPLLCAAYEDTVTMPQRIRELIRSACEQAGFGINEVNPVERVPIHPIGNGAELDFIELTTSEPSESAGTGSMCSRLWTNDNAVMAQVMNNRRRLEEVSVNWISDSARKHSSVLQMLQNIDRSIKRLAMQPVARPDLSRLRSRGESPSAPNEPRNRAIVKLTKNPKDLYTLWKEFEFGISGAKTAKFYTARERGENKFFYSRRKIFWDVVSNMERKGFTSDAAIDEVYITYGAGLSVSKILLLMRNDRKTGGHPHLR